MVQGKRTVTDKEIEQKMHELPSPAFTTGELAGHFDMTTEGMRLRLEKLRNEGVVHRKKPSQRTVIWWVG
jgi:predicted ArsR family transcriptional regulator